MTNEKFALHIRKRRFVSKVLCEGLVGGGCDGKYSVRAMATNIIVDKLFLEFFHLVYIIHNIYCE